MIRLEEDYIELIKEIYEICQVDDLTRFNDIERIAMVAVMQNEAIDKVIAMIDEFRAKSSRRVMMADPLFSVGEDVFLQSVSRPECNGPDRVISIVCPNHGHCDRYGYLLAIAVSRGPKQGWCECTLRKRPPPDEEFKTFMDSLNLTDKIVEKVES